MGPLNLTESIGAAGENIVLVLLGVAFGWILESAGFADSRNIAGQFYFSTNKVLKVMFTAIVVAMALLLLSSSLGLMDLDALWINPTFPKTVMIGGLLMGLGFVVAGLCPGTSLASMATGKIDGMFVVLGITLGIIGFDELEGSFDAWYNAGGYGPITIWGVTGINPGYVLLVVVLVALGLFVSFEAIQRKLYGGDPPSPKARMYRRAGAGLAVGVALLVTALGPQTPEEKWASMAGNFTEALEGRGVYVDPADMLDSMEDFYTDLRIIDVRTEPEWNIFHIHGSRRVELKDLPKLEKEFKTLPGNAVIVFVSNGEKRSTEAWKLAMTMGQPNAYILAGGLDEWRKIYSKEAVAKAKEEEEKKMAKQIEVAESPAVLPTKPKMDPKKFWEIGHIPLFPDSRQDIWPDHWIVEPPHDRPMALGDRTYPARVNPHTAPEREFEKKIKLKVKVAKAGGCG